VALDKSCADRAVQKVLHVVVDQSAQKLLLDLVIAFLVVRARDAGLETNLVGLVEHLLLSLFARLLRPLWLFSFLICLGRQWCSLLVTGLRTLTLFPFLDGIALHSSESAQNPQEQLTLLRLQVVFDAVDHVSGFLLVLQLQEPLELKLVNALHFVGSAQFFPLKRVRVDLVDAAEELLLDVKAALLGSFQVLEGTEAKASEHFSGYTVDSRLADGQLEVLHFAELAKELGQLFLQVLS